MQLKKMILLIMLMFSLNAGDVFANEYLPLNNQVQSLALSDNDPKVVVCHEPEVLKALRIIGMVIVIIKVLVPVLVIVTGIQNLAKTVIQEDDSAIKKSVSLLMVKFFVGAFVFFIPTVMYTLMSVASGYDETASKFTDCGKCITSVSACNGLIDQYSN